MLHATLTLHVHVGARARIPSPSLGRRFFSLTRASFSGAILRAIRLSLTGGRCGAAAGLVEEKARRSSAHPSLLPRPPFDWQGSYRRVCVQQRRPALGAFKAELTRSLKVDDEIAAAAISQVRLAIGAVGSLLGYASRVGL
eukprot:scaffold312498_cov33-Tisochrysis_lutea.AAC.3